MTSKSIICFERNDRKLLDQGREVNIGLLGRFFEEPCLGSGLFLIFSQCQMTVFWFCEGFNVFTSCWFYLGSGKVILIDRFSLLCRDWIGAVYLRDCFAALYRSSEWLY